MQEFARKDAVAQALPPPVVVPVVPVVHSQAPSGHLAKPYARGRSMDLLYVFNRHFFDNEYMHFGYWESGLEVKYLHLKQAQIRYVEEFFKLIPDDAGAILDVGCGSGEMASQLIKQGRQVDCVCPPSVLSHFAKEKLAGRARNPGSRIWT
jgi:hypothetical protein